MVHSQNYRSKWLLGQSTSRKYRFWDAIMFTRKKIYSISSKASSRRLVLQYYLPNKVMIQEKYAHSLLVCFSHSLLSHNCGKIVAIVIGCKNWMFYNQLEEIVERLNQTVKLLILFTCRSKKMLMVQKELCLLKLVVQVMIVIVVKNLVMILDSQMQEPKLGL